LAGTPESLEPSRAVYSETNFLNSSKVIGGLAGVALGLAVGARIAVAGGFLLQRVGRTQAEADVGFTLLEIDVLADEVLIHLARLDDVMADEVEDRQIGLGLKIIGMSASSNERCSKVDNTPP
jgi:hypothetical protein